MRSLSIDSSGPRNGLLTGRHVDDGGAVWASELDWAATLAVGLRSDVRRNARSALDAWPVEVHVSGRPLILADVDIDGVGHPSLDRPELSAGQAWRGVTRDAARFEPRPWLAVIRIAHVDEPDATGVERLTQLVAARILDAACVVVPDEAGDRVWSPDPAMSIERSMLRCSVGASI